jgi:hypothetical protein
MDQLGVHDKCTPHDVDFSALQRRPKDGYRPPKWDATGTTSSL